MESGREAQRAAVRLHPTQRRREDCDDHPSGCKRTGDERRSEMNPRLIRVPAGPNGHALRRHLLGMCLVPLVIVALAVPAGAHTVYGVPARGAVVVAPRPPVVVAPAPRAVVVAPAPRAVVVVAP